MPTKKPGQLQNPIVSVVIPTFARPAQLAECLAALVKQTFLEPWEIVIVDDGSPKQEEIAIVAASALHHNRNQRTNITLRLLRQENKGPSEARNHGVHCANGHLIALTDDDCRPERTWLEQLVRRWRRDSNALIGGSTINGIRTDLFASTSQLIVDLVYEHFNSDPGDAFFLTSNNMLCSKQQFITLGGFDADFPRAGGEDRDFCDRWRSRQWPIIWEKSAQIKHYHRQTLKKFVDLHVRYGRGAFLYQSKRRLRNSGSMRQDIGFHKTFTARLQKHLEEHPIDHPWHSIALALLIWQAANLFGFIQEGINTGMGNRPKADQP